MTSSRRSIPTADRISVLPDSILSHILSFLPTKHAATTSVLSKRWKPLWLSLFTLHFDITSFNSSPSRIISAMHSIMHRRETTLPIHSFRFICHNSLCNRNDMNLFIEYVRLRGVQNFTLDLMLPFTNVSYELPRSVLNCDTLEVLKLKGIKVGDISHRLDFHLPKLKTLHLNYVIFQCNQHLYNLLLSCPVLQDFKSKHSVHLEEILPETSKVLPNLIKTKLNDDLTRCPLTMFCNTMIMCVDMSKRSCFINNLVVFRTMPTFQRLTHLEFSFQDIHWFDRSIWLLAIVKYSPKLQNLIIQDIGLLKETNGLYWKDPQIVPECLSSELKTCCLSGYKGTKWDFSFAKYILENSKVLNTMTFYTNWSLGINEKHRMLSELSSYTRASTTCKFLFD